MFGFILIELGLPTLLARMIDVGIRNGDREYIWKMGMAMIAITLTGIAMNIMLGYFTSRITTNIVADVRDDLLKRCKVIHIRNMKNRCFILDYSGDQ